MGRPPVAIEKRLFPKLLITPCSLDVDDMGRPIVGPCLIWQGGKNERGYGSIWDNGHQGNQRVHRVMYRLFVGPISDELDHLCKVPSCASPAHLEDVIHAVNNERRRPNRGYSKPRKRKTHCVRGHERTSENLTVQVRADGRMNSKCKVCDREKKRELRAAGRYQSQSSA